MSRRLLVPLVALALAGCEARLEPLTSPPPGAEVDLDSSADHLRISRGAAVGIECTDQGFTCSGLSVEADDGGVALARIAFQDDLVRNGAEGQTERSAFVVAGLAPGETKVHLAWDGGDLTLTVEVVDP